MNNRHLSIAFGVAAVALVLAWGVRAPMADNAVDANLLVETRDLAVLLDEPGLSLTDSVRIVDVRPAQAFALGHIPGAVHLAVDTVVDPVNANDGAFKDQETLMAMLDARGIDKDSRIIVYGDNGGLHASRLFWMFSYLGHDDVAILNGGWPKWQQEGHQVNCRVSDIKGAG